jgi:hypothetical protein
VSVLLVGPEQVLSLLKCHGVQWHSNLCYAAAYNNRLTLLQWLHEYARPWEDERGVCLNAAKGGSVPMLTWLRAVTSPWPADVLQLLLSAAACRDGADRAMWLRALGADWPHAFVREYPDDDDNLVRECWSSALVKWALACGSGWRDWGCEDYAADSYAYDTDAAQATALLEWAHANGCPCTCGHAQQQQQQQQQ